MTFIKQQQSLLFRPEYLPSKYYIELIRVLNIRTRHQARHHASVLGPMRVCVLKARRAAIHETLIC